MTSLSSATTGALNPSPTFICQSATGPSLGHCRLIADTLSPFRRGPRNCGQSSARATRESSRAVFRMAVRRHIRYLSSVGFQQYGAQLLRVIEKGTLSDDAFNELALELFALQIEHNAAYGKLCGKGKNPRSWREIPVVPTVAF